MPPVFGHGRLRLYLLKLLDAGEHHGYELIRLLEERFMGLYAPSAGTIYPRLARMEAEGLIAHSEEGGRKVYRITDAGRAELARRAAELDTLETEIRASVHELATEIGQDVRGSVSDLRDELKRAAARARREQPRSRRGWTLFRGWPEPQRRTGAERAAAVRAFERQLGEFREEAAELAARPGVSEDDLRTAAAVLDEALRQIRACLPDPGPRER